MIYARHIYLYTCILYSVYPSINILNKLVNRNTLRKHFSFNHSKHENMKFQKSILTLDFNLDQRTNSKNTYSIQLSTHSNNILYYYTLYYNNMVKKKI